MMSKLLSTSRSEALAYACASLQGDFPVLTATSVDVIKLASLALILDGKALRDDEVIAFADRFEELANQGEEGPWLYACPRELLVSLAELHPSRQSVVAMEWILTEEAQLDRWNEADATVCLQALSHLCAGTIAEERDLFLFICL